MELSLKEETLATLGKEKLETTESLTARHHEELAQISNDHQLEVEANQQQWQAKMDSIIAQLEDRLKEATQEKETALASLQSSHEQALEAVRVEWKTKFQEREKSSSKKTEEQVAKLNDELSKVSRERDIYAKQVEQAKSSSTQSALELEEKIKTVKAQTEALLLRKEQEFADLQVQLRTKENSLKEFQALLALRDIDVEELTGKLTELESQVETRKAEIKKKAETKVAGMRKQFNTQLEQVTKGHEAEMADMKQNEEDLKITITNLQSDLAEREESLKNMEKSFSDEKSSFEDRNHSLNEQVQSLQQQIDSRDEANRVQQLEVEQQQQQSVEQFGKEQEQLTSRLQDCERELEEKKNIEAQLREQLASCEKQVTDLTQQKQEADENTSQLEKKLEKASSVLKQQTASLKKDNEELANEWEGKMQETLTVAQQERQTLLQQHKSQVAAITAEFETSQITIAQLQQDYEAVQAECVELKEQLASKEGQDAKISLLEEKVLALTSEQQAVLAELEHEAERKVTAIREESDSALQEKEDKQKEKMAALQAQFSEERAKLEAAMLDKEQNIQQELSNVKLMLEASKLEAHSAQEQLAAERSRIEQLQKDSSTEMAHIESQQSLEQALAEKEAAVESVRQSHATELAEVKQFYENDLEQLRAEVASLTAERSTDKKKDSMIKEYQKSLSSNEKERLKLVEDKRSLQVEWTTRYCKY